MTKAELRNALCILQSIDRHEFVEAGIDLSTAEWLEFSCNPARWFVRACDADSDKVWAVVERRAGR